MTKKKFTLLIVVSSLFTTALQTCIRRPPGALGESSPVDDSFRITIEGNPATYIPGQSYNVTLSCDKVFKFISFNLVAEPEPGTTYGADMAGHFDIIDPTETRFSNLCENLVESSNTNLKYRADVAWVAPTNPNSTCVYIKAAVLQHRDVWFMDDGLLTKRICPEEIDDVNSQTPLVNPCCACDEAKYELILERRWTRNTHPKDFPQDDWRTRFSELIGASHSYDYRFWAYGSRASPGIKEIAEHGATKTLEEEIKAEIESGVIRTIIKAPGVAFRKNVMSTTLATVRVDPRHHLVSFVTKIIPSPDWILGVAALELCLANCTWIDKKVLNLFPWDIGTDSGPSYMSPDQQQVPADVVRRITSTFPSDYRSPFYDETGAPMKPMATLYMTRKKIYEKECEEDGNVPVECATHPWVEWTECSTKCGAGTQYRERNYKDLQLAARYNCEVPLRQTQRCVGTQCGLQEDDEDFGNRQTAECELTNWSNWGPCSKSCGRGFAKRTRDYRNPYTRENCQAGFRVELEQTKECLGDACGGSISGGYGNENNDFDQYSREPGLLEEESINTGYDGRDQNFNPNRPSNVGWNTNDRYSNRQSGFGDINNRNNEQLNGNFGFGGNYSYDQNSRLEQNNFPDNNNQANNFGYPNNDENNLNSNSNNIAWMDGKSDNMKDNNFNNDKNNQFDNSYNQMLPPIYNQQQLPIERITDRFQSPGFYPPTMETVVQEYCFEKPFVVRKTCPGRKKIANYWFFDADDRQCKIFTTDNCDENKNKFRSLESCEGTCLQPQLNLEEQQYQQEPMEQNNWSNQFGAPQSQIRQTKFSGRRQQNFKQNIHQQNIYQNNRQNQQIRQRNREPNNYNNQRRV